MDIELVIKMPEDLLRYFDIFYLMNVNENKNVDKLVEVIKKGKPLPKGHGRIGDLDALRCENTDFDTYNDYCIMFDEIKAAETIIEADKAESEDKE